MKLSELKRLYRMVEFWWKDNIVSGPREWAREIVSRELKIAQLEAKLEAIECERSEWCVGTGMEEIGEIEVGDIFDGPNSRWVWDGNGWIKCDRMTHSVASNDES